MSGQQKYNGIETLLKAGIIAPTATIHKKPRHKRANYKEDVRPFASGLGWALSLVVAGLVIGAAALVTLIFHGAGLFPEEQSLLTMELFVAAAGAAAAAYGIGFALQLREMKAHYIQRLYSEEHQSTHYQPIQPIEEKREQAVFLRAEKTSTRIPANIKIQDLAGYVNAILSGRAAISEAGAHDYKIRGRQWEVFRDWSIEHGIFAWKDERHHQLGLEIAGPGGYAALRAIATGEYT